MYKHFNNKMKLYTERKAVTFENIIKYKFEPEIKKKKTGKNKTIL